MASAPPTKPTIVVAPGMCSKPEHYKYVTKQLEQAGYNVSGVKYPSVGVLPTPLENGFEADAIAIRDTIQPILDQGTDVVLVMHSYGGAVGDEAVFMLKKASKGKIVRLVYIAVPINPPILVIELVDNHLLYVRNPIESFYHDVSKERADEAVALLDPMQLSSTPPPHAARKEVEIPATFVACKQDRAVLFSDQEKMIEVIKASNSEVETVTLDCGHSPHLTHEGRVADIIRTAAGETL